MAHFAVPVLVPLSLLALLTAVFRWSDADIAICRMFYRGAASPWPWGGATGWRLIYEYGNLPGLALGIGGLITAIASYVWPRLRPYRRAGFFLAVVLAVGPGLLVNGVFKPHWCRPRPREISDFGGSQAYLPVWSWNSACTSKSFPSGHASMGFYLMVPAFLLYRRRRRLALAFVAIGLGAGGLVGLSRIVQGGHFPSDVLWSGGMVYLSALAVNALFQRCVPALGVPGTAPGQSAPLATAPRTEGAASPQIDRPAPRDEDADRRQAA